MYIKGNMFQSPAQVLVNTVNTVGVMGKGIALEFKKLYPEMYQQYRELCERGKFGIGMLWLWFFGIPQGKATYGGTPIRRIGDNPQGQGKGVGIESRPEGCHSSAA